jgi:hypothetical protein
MPTEPEQGSFSSRLAGTSDKRNRLEGRSAETLGDLLEGLKSQELAGDLLACCEMGVPAGCSRIPTEKFTKSNKQT